MQCLAWFYTCCIIYDYVHARIANFIYCGCDRAVAQEKEQSDCVRLYVSEGESSECWDLHLIMRFYTLNRAALAVMVMACLTVATGQLPCDSVLRRLPSFSHLFAHCECLYSQWTDWVAINRTAVPTSQCPSGSALKRERRQVVISGECDDIVQTNTTCKY